MPPIPARKPAKSAKPAKPAPLAISRPIDLPPEPSLIKHKSLADALFAAQRDILPVLKGSEVESANKLFKDVQYKYASTDWIMAEAKKVLNQNGLMVQALGADVALLAPNMAKVTCFFDLSHTSSSETRKDTSAAVAVAMDQYPLDKAVLGTRTSLWGYYLRDLLMLPRFDEQEISARNDQDYRAGTFGREAAIWIKGEIARRASLTLDGVRRKIAAAEPQFADSVAGDLPTWPADLIPRLKKMFDAWDEKHAGAAKSNGPNTPIKPITKPPQLAAR